MHPRGNCWTIYIALSNLEKQGDLNFSLEYRLKMVPKPSLVCRPSKELQRVQTWGNNQQIAGIHDCKEKDNEAELEYKVVVHGREREIQVMFLLFLKFQCRTIDLFMTKHTPPSTA